MALPRPVKIEDTSDSWLVVYMDRKPHQRHLAASFYKSDTNRAKVVQWVADNPRIVLADTEERLEKCEAVLRELLRVGRLRSRGQCKLSEWENAWMAAHRLDVTERPQS